MEKLFGGNQQTAFGGGEIIMKYITKQDFLNGLSEALYCYDITDTRDILLDFEQHFDDGAAAGLSEQEVCEKLGDVAEIAKQYVDADFADTIPTSKPEPVNAPEASGFGAETADAVTATATPVQPTQPVQPSAQPEKFKPDGGKVTAVILVDILVFSWAIPSLISVILSFYSGVAGIGISGLGIFLGGITACFTPAAGIIASSLSPISTILLGLLIMSLCSLLVLLCILICKGFIYIMKCIINWHSNTFAGKSVCKTKKEENK